MYKLYFKHQAVFIHTRVGLGNLIGKLDIYSVEREFPGKTTEIEKV